MDDLRFGDTDDENGESRETSAPVVPMFGQSVRHDVAFDAPTSEDPAYEDPAYEEPAYEEPASGEEASAEESGRSWLFSFDELVAAGAQFTEVSVDKARAIVDGFVREGRVKRSVASDAIDELVEASRTRARSFRDAMRIEVDDAVSSLRMPTRSEFDELEQRVTTLMRDAEAAITRFARDGRDRRGEADDDVSTPKKDKKKGKKDKSKKDKKKKKDQQKHKSGAAARAEEGDGE